MLCFGVIKIKKECYNNIIKNGVLCGEGEKGAISVAGDVCDTSPGRGLNFAHEIAFPHRPHTHTYNVFVSPPIFITVKMIISTTVRSPEVICFDYVRQSQGQIQGRMTPRRPRVDDFLKVCRVFIELVIFFLLFIYFLIFYVVQGQRSDH